MASKHRRTPKNKKAEYKNQKVKFGLIALFILILLVLFNFSKNRRSDEFTEAVPSNDGEVAATLEAKLKEIYERRAGTTLGDDFSPRFSVFEDLQLGFKIAYPVGFVTTSTGNGVLIKPEQGGGSISVNVTGEAFDVKAETSGLSEKQTDILEGFYNNPDAALGAVRVYKNSIGQGSVSSLEEILRS